MLEQPSHQALALRAARESPALLTNVGGELPWDVAPITTSSSTSRKVHRIAVIGPLGNSSQTMMGAKDDYHPSFTITYLQGIVAVAAQLMNRRASGPEFESWLRSPGSPESPDYSSESAGLPSDVVRLMSAVHHVTSATPGLGSLPVLTPSDADAAVASHSVEQAAGVYGPAGEIHRFRIEAPRIESEAPASLEVVFAPGCKDTHCPDKSLFPAAIQAVNGADAIVLFLGIDILIEKEGQDRDGITLPGL